MKIATKASVVLAAAAMSIGLLGSPASALDSSWGCGGCIVSQDGGKFIPKGQSGGKFIPKDKSAGKFIPKGESGGKFIPKTFIP